MSEISIYKEKNISKAVLIAGIPAMLGQLTSLIYNIADTYFVSLTHDPAQIAAVTLCAPILIIIMSIACIFGLGGTSVISRWLGQKKEKDATYCFNFCLYALVISGVLVLALGLIFLKDIATISGADETNYEFTCNYLVWIFVGAPFIILTNGLVYIVRTVGLIKESTIGIALGNGVNILFDWIFIVLLGMGTAGAAMATSIGFFCSTVYYFICMYKKKRAGNDFISMSPRMFKPTKRIIAGVMQIGIPGALVTILMSVSNIVLNNFIALYGSDSVASYGIASKIDMFPILLSVGLSQGVGPLIGYYYGAGDKKTLAKIMRISTIYGVILGAAFMLLFLFSNNFLAGIFMERPELVSQTALFILLLCFHDPLLGIINMIISYFQSLGKAVQSLLLTIFKNAAFFIPGLAIMNILIGLNGVILTTFIVDVLITIVGLFMYSKSSPKRMEVETPQQEYVESAVEY